VIKVLVVDDEELVRDGLRLILDAEHDLEVVGEAADAAQAVSEGIRLLPDVVLMDIRMPGTDGIEATRRLLRDSRVPAKVLMLTTFDSDRNVYEALKAGASGFMLKDAPRAELVAAIRTVAAGEALLAPSITRRLIETFCRRPAPGGELRDQSTTLTGREVEVLRLIARGLSNAEIAETLFLSQATVKSHVRQILSKLDLRDRVQAVVFAYESGLVEPGSEATAP
jgi:DNA-binding NarL/FixJ family response regulator